MKLMKEAKIEKSCKDIIEDLVYNDLLDETVNERITVNNEVRHLKWVTTDSDMREVYA